MNYPTNYTTTSSTGAYTTTPTYDIRTSINISELYPKGVIKYVKIVKDSHPYAVDFENFYKGHDCSIFDKVCCGKDSGWWCTERELRLIPNKINNWKQEMKK